MNLVEKRIFDYSKVKLQFGLFCLTMLLVQDRPTSHSGFLNIEIFLRTYYFKSIFKLFGLITSYHSITGA